jgi:hypothetical protein
MGKKVKEKNPLGKVCFVSYAKDEMGITEQSAREWIIKNLKPYDPETDEGDYIKGNKAYIILKESLKKYKKK